MKSDIVQRASSKAGACLCVVSSTITTAEENAIISCHEETDVSAAAAVSALWSGTNKNRDISTGPFACPFARLLIPLTHFTHSLACGKVNF